jgi:hypothetical protein
VFDAPNLKRQKLTVSFKIPEEAGLIEGGDILVE